MNGKEHLRRHHITRGEDYFMLMTAKETRSWHILFGKRSLKEIIDDLQSIYNHLKEKRNSKYMNKPIFFRQAYVRPAQRRNHQAIR